MGGPGRTLSKGLDDRASFLSEGLDPALLLVSLVFKTTDLNKSRTIFML